MSMVELQSCASLVNASSALRAIEQEVKGESVNVIAEISAELQREREKNSELMGRISILEAQIQEKNKESLVTDGQDSYINATDRRFKKFKRQKIETSIDRIDDGIVIKSKMASKAKHDTQSQCIPHTDANLDDRLVNWMSMDENQFLHFDKLKDGESAADCEDTDDSDEEDDDYYEEDNPNIDHKDREIDEKLLSANELKEHNHRDDFDKRICIPCSENFSSGHPTQITNEDSRKDCLLPDMKPDYPRRDIKKHDKKETKKIGGYRTPDELITSGSILMHKRPPKVPFCPREVKRILESEALSLKNAHTHTIRKIVVFSSLGIRHGCEDMYELDFNHFRILRKGESYVSAKNPGEHVLYENPGVRRKVFYPNRQNPILCPVQILEEEKAMRPSDPSCPSCLFLCIKYGGRTRNLPQNEYVRQRMGRNKLKSFGPCMCRMAALVHIRSGSFFFKALGITLLFMAGFPVDMVQMETKYRNLDLLQKYYRTDEVPEGEELFLLHPTTCNNQLSPGSQQLTGKMTLTKPKGKKQTNTTSKPHNLPGSSIQKSVPSSAAPPAQFGIMGYTSIQTHAMAALQSTQSQTPADTPPVSNTMITSSGTNIFYQNQNPYHMFPPQPANAFVPMMYWPPPSAFPPGPYPTTCSYQSFPFPANYMSIHPRQYYSHPSCNPFLPKMVENCGKNDVALEEADSDSDSSSSSTEPKEALACCKQ